MPHRLDDNLQWQCSICQCIVPTFETHSHLMTCFDSNSESTDSEEPCLPIVFEEPVFQKKMLPMEAKSLSKASRQARPKTKKLERPTPNITHPIIDQVSSPKSSPELAIQKKIEDRSPLLGKSYSSKKLKPSEKTRVYETKQSVSEIKLKECSFKTSLEKPSYQEFETNLPIKDEASQKRDKSHTTEISQSGKIESRENSNFQNASNGGKHLVEALTNISIASKEVEEAIIQENAKQSKVNKP